MSGIRPFTAEDLPAVGAIYEEIMRSGGRTPSPALVEYFRRIFLDDPWADARTPSLVYEADGRVVGFIGSSTRRMRLDGRAIRMVCSSNLVVEPAFRPRGVGALLQRQLMRGPQDITIADRANDDSRAMWLGLGGQELVHASVGWYRVFRPGGTVGALLGQKGRGGGRAGRAAQLVAHPVDALAGRVRRDALTPVAPDATGEPLTADLLLEQMSSAGRYLRLHPDYDAEFLAWLFAELEAMGPRGRLVGRLVRNAKGRVLGWYLYLLPPRGVAQVLQLGVPGPDPEPVIDHLLWQAHADGAAAVQGRLEPALSGILARPGVVLRKTARALVASEDSTALAVLGSPKALLSHLDGEWAVAHGRHQ